MPFMKSYPGWAQPCPRTGGAPCACGHYIHSAPRSRAADGRGTMEREVRR
jgi:hypothetical protein